MKRVKTLLKMIKKGVEEAPINTSGGCAMCHIIQDFSFSDKEYNRMIDYLNDNAPQFIKNRFKKARFKGTNDNDKHTDHYWWDYNDKKPRIKWLNKQIAKL